MTLACLRHYSCSCSPVVPAGRPANQGSKQDTLYRLTILHTNDHHGRFWNNRYGEYGMAARKTLVDRIRKEVAAQGGHVLLLDAGDINTGVPESDILDAEPDIRAMNRIGYDAMAADNHEFDNISEVLKKHTPLKVADYAPTG